MTERDNHRGRPPLNGAPKRNHNLRLRVDVSEYLRASGNASVCVEQLVDRERERSAKREARRKA